jgi:DNA-binding response OmpR family regulator
VEAGSVIGDRATGRVPDHPAPEIDSLGLLHFGGRWLSLSPTQEAIMRSLAGRFGRPISRTEVAAAVWPSGGPDQHAIDVHIHRLRPRLREVGLVIHTLRGRGFLLETLRAG